MSVETIFQQLGDRQSWPAPPVRPLLPGDPSMLRPAELIPVPIEELIEQMRLWTPSPDEAESG